MTTTDSRPFLVRPVSSRQDMKNFINLPWDIYRDNPLWPPPLKSSVRDLLNRKKHPFWKFAEGELFIAERQNRVIGRIVALIDANSNDYHHEEAGAWGFFECIDDREIAASLFSAAEDWLRERGMKTVRGPLNPSTNYEIGTLIKGYDKEPALMMTYNPEYYPKLIHRAGYRKEKDILSYRVTRAYTPPDWTREIAARLRESNDITVHCPSKWTRENVRLMCAIYRDCWADNWGFVPMTAEEEDEMAKELLFLLEPELAFFIHHREEPVGIGLLLPDFNPLLKRFNGKLGLSTLIKKYLYISEVKGLRGLLFGVRQNHRQSGLHLVAIHHVLDILNSVDKYEYAELGWTLEDNEGINNLFQENGLLPDKRYRIYRKALAG
jgi:hypothetical protein